MKKLLIYAIFAVSAVMFYQNRYRLMNTVLSQPGIRRSFIHLFLRIPLDRKSVV